MIPINIGSPYKLHAAVEAAFPPDAVRRTDDGRILWRLDSLGQDGGVWLYRECSERTGVEWDKRTYDHDDFDAGLWG